MNSETYLSLLFRSLPLLLQGLAMTVQILICSASLSLIFGSCFGIASCQRLKIPYLGQAIEAITFILRAIPFFVQLLLAYFVLPDLLGIQIQPFTASVVALGLCSSGYVAQFIRGSINAIPLAQWEAALSLGMNTPQTLRWVILPQVGRSCLPMLNNELDALLKSTATASSIGMLELTRVGMNLVSREMEPVAIYLTVAFFYICMSALLNCIARVCERRWVYVRG